jgi:excisionase family DNA binding protein
VDDQEVMPNAVQPDWMPDAPLLLSERQAAALIGVSERTVKRLIFAGELTRRKIGSRTLIPRSAIESFVKRDHQTETEEEKEERRRRAIERERRAEDAK